MWHSMRKMKNLLLFNICYRLGTTHLPYPPLLINLEPTNHCNLRCPMCPVSQMLANPTVSRGLMEMNRFEKIVKEIAPFGPEIALNMGGESTLHPELPRMVRMLKAAGLYVFLDTNATRLTPQLSAGLIEAGLDRIVFCLDGDSPESYEAIRARAKFERTVENIHRFLHMRRDANQNVPYVIIKNIQYYDPQKKPIFPKAFAELFADCPPDEYSFIWADHWPGSHRHLLKEPYTVQPYGEKYSPCINLWKMLPISWDGMVYICCLDLNRTTPIGNLQEMGLWGIWNSPVFQELRQKHASGKQAELSLCQNCNQIRRQPASGLAGLLQGRDLRFTLCNRIKPKKENSEEYS